MLFLHMLVVVALVDVDGMAWHGMASYMIVPATARPSVPPRFLTKLCESV